MTYLCDFEQIWVFAPYTVPSIACDTKSRHVHVTIFKSGKSKSFSSTDILIRYEKRLQKFDFVIFQKLGVLVYAGINADTVKDMQRLGVSYAYRLQNRIERVSSQESVRAAWRSAATHAKLYHEIPLMSILRHTESELGESDNILELPVLDCALEVFAIQNFYEVWKVTGADKLLKLVSESIDVKKFHFLLLEILFKHEEMHHLCRVGLVSTKGHHNIPWNCVDSLTNQVNGAMCPGFPELDARSSKCIDILLLLPNSADVSHELNDVNTPHYGAEND